MVSFKFKKNWEVLAKKKSHKIHELYSIHFCGSGYHSKCSLKNPRLGLGLSFQKILLEINTFFASEYPCNNIPLKVHLCSYDVLKKSTKKLEKSMNYI